MSQAVTTAAAVRQLKYQAGNTVISMRRFCLNDKFDSGKLQKNMIHVYILKKTVNFTVTEFVDLLSGNDKSANRTTRRG